MKNNNQVRERTIRELAAETANFAQERDWIRFHTPRNLATALAVEAAELLEPFQWNRDNEEVSSELRENIAGELADILLYVLGLANSLGIDVDHAVADKMRLNAVRYPVGHAASGPWYPRTR